MSRRVRRPVAVAVALASLALGAWSGRRAEPLPDLPYNILLVLTDDQALASMTSDPPAMPWLRDQLADPSSGWVAYPQAVVSTPICCPSRATILTGRGSWATGVVDNHTGWRLDESDTIATRLHDAGYRTALIGKYLNEYPFDRGPYVPPGWDRWFAKTNESAETTYFGYPVVDQGVVRLFGRGPGDYVTDVLGAEAESTLWSEPRDRPWFLLFAPPAPHAPFAPAPRHLGAVEGFEAPPVGTWTGGRAASLAALPALRPPDLASLARQRARASATLLAVDEHLHAMVDLIVTRGEWDRTVVVFLSDNGLAFGEHGWAGKRVPYEASIDVPFAVRWPPAVAAAPGTGLVSNLDIAPTIAALAGLPPRTTDGLSLLGAIPASRTVPLWWGGDEEVPAWRGVRSAGAVLIEWSSGERELFDLRGDPGQTRNLIDDPAWSGVARRLAGLLPRAAFPPG